MKEKLNYNSGFFCEKIFILINARWDFPTISINKKEYEAHASRQ